MNPARSLITGTICGVRIEEIEEPLMREIRYLDKLVDELAKGEGDGEGFEGVGRPGSRRMRIHGRGYLRRREFTCKSRESA
jgi:hypothetical protein